MKVKSKDYREFLLQELSQDPGLAAGYLTASFEDGDKDAFLGALRDVVDALGGVTKISKKTKLNRSNIYKMLNGNPTIASLASILNTAGLGISFYNKKAS